MPECLCVSSSLTVRVAFSLSLSHTHTHSHREIKSKQLPFQYNVCQACGEKTHLNGQIKDKQQQCVPGTRGKHLIWQRANLGVAGVVLDVAEGLEQDRLLHVTSQYCGALHGPGSMVQDLGLRVKVWGLEKGPRADKEGFAAACRVQGAGPRVYGLWSRVLGSRAWDQARVKGLGSKGGGSKVVGVGGRGGEDEEDVDEDDGGEEEEGE
eukprot:3941941-Rhodomonas_salina.7